MNSRAWPYLVGPMQLDDLPTVSAIERLVYTRPWPMEAYNYELLENPKSHYLVARLKRTTKQKPGQRLKALLRRAISGPELDETLLGYGGLWLMVDEAHVSTLAVHIAWQRRGIGELLLASLIEKAMELAAAYMTLEVRVSNYRAQRLYAKYGFRQVGLRKRYYSDNNEDAYIMTTDSIASSAYQTRFQALVVALDAKLRAQGSAQGFQQDRDLFTDAPLPASGEGR